MGEINQYLGLLLALAAALTLVFAPAPRTRHLLLRELAKERQAQIDAASRRGNGFAYPSLRRGNLRGLRQSSSSGK